MSFFIIILSYKTLLFINDNELNFAFQYCTVRKRFNELDKCNGWYGQLPQARLRIVVPVWGWIRNFELRVLNYFLYRMDVAVNCEELWCQFSGYVEYKTGNINCTFLVSADTFYNTCLSNCMFQIGIVIWSSFF